jgi:hypothetical protein
LGSSLDLWGVLNVSTIPATDCPYLTASRSSETTDQSRLIPCLVHPGIARLSPTIIAVYLQSMTKVFGSWTANLANQWGDDELVQVQELVPNIISRLETFTGSADIEVQERVRRITIFEKVSNNHTRRLPMFFNFSISFRQIYPPSNLGQNLNMIHRSRMFRQIQTFLKAYISSNHWFLLTS